MPKRLASTASESTAIEPAALTAAISEALRSQALLDILIPALSNAIADTITQDIHKALELELLNRDKKIASLEKDVRHLTERLSEQEQYSRRNCLIVHGIPETPQPENTDQKITEAAKQHLGIELRPEALDRSHRIGPRLDKTGKPRARPLVVKFVDYNSRAAFYRLRAKFKGSNIYVHESLTQERQGWLTMAISVNR